MQSGFEILWTDFALEELAQTIEYLEERFTEKEINTLAIEIENITNLISGNPYLFPESDTKGVRRVSVLTLNTMYYRVVNNSVEIVSFFSNRRHPAKRRI